MEQRIFHGKIRPRDLAQALVAEFNRGNLYARQFGNDQETVVQIATHPSAGSGGQTGLTVTLRAVPDGVAIQVGKQSWLGIAASLGQSAFWALRSPWNLLGRLDDIAQDVESLQIPEKVWEIVDRTARSLGANYELSERLRRLVCEYCLAANPVGEATCLACGAPLGRAQPRTCRSCGYVVRTHETTCPNCKRAL